MISDIIERARALLFRSRAEQEMDEEMRDHIERETEARVRAGVDPETARREALVAFGGIERRKEEVREARGTLILENVASDLKHAVRTLVRNPIFALTATVILALGVGAASAVYGLANAVLFDELPYPESNRLVRIYQSYTEANRFGLSVVDAQAISEQQRSFESFGAMRPGSATLVVNGTSEARGVGRGTSSFFTTLGVRAAAGRLIQPSDEVQNAPPVLVLQHQAAERWYGSAPAAVGKTIGIDGVNYTVVGVMASEFRDMGGFAAAAWQPLRMPPPERRGPFGIRGFGRLRPGVTVEDASRDLAGISVRLFPVWKASFRDSTARFTPIPLREAILGDNTERQVTLLATGVTLVLLVAIANVALLTLVRISSREGELAVRSALGAARWRIAGLLASEGLVLGLMSAIAGFALAWLLLKVTPTMLPTIPRVRDVSANLGVAAIAALVALVAAMASTVFPILSLFARKGNPTLTAECRVGANRKTNTVRNVLVAAEFGLALPLLFGAALLLNSFMRLQRVDPGYDPDGAIGVQVGLPLTRYNEPAMGLRFWTEVEQRLRETAAFSGVGIGSSIPPTEPDDINNFDLKDRPVPAGGAEHVSPWLTVSNGYFEAMQIKLLDGRLFLPNDTGVAPVVVVSRSWKEKYYPDMSPLGKELIAGGCTTCPPTVVVGVVEDVKYNGLAQSSEAVYVPLAQNIPSSTNIVVRTRDGLITPAASRQIRDVIASLDPELPVIETTLREAMDGALADPRRWTSILGAFSVAAIVLATVGIFGLNAYTVRQRRREIGVRMALGATADSVVWMIVAKGMRYAVVGSTVGLLVALSSGKLIGSFLYGVSASDPLTLVGVLGLLLVAGVMACWLAARRAAAIHPVEAIASQ